MIISRTPYRISFFGGGSDYPDWYRAHGGCVLSTTINKYQYITCRELPPIFSYKYRIRYYEREEVSDISQVRHPSVRECVRYMNSDKPLDIVHYGDLPARSGMGSSSGFTVGFLACLYAMQNKLFSKREIAAAAIKIEQEIIAEAVGSQDQIAAAFGGFNQITFGDTNEFIVTPITASREVLNQIEASLVLIYTGQVRSAHIVAKEQIENIRNNKNNFSQFAELARAAVSLMFSESFSIKEFGRLMDEQWMMKSRLTDKITNTLIDQIYAKAKQAGAYGGKLLGAGGGGFMVFVANPDSKEKIITALKPLVNVPIRLETTGAQIVYYSTAD